MHIPPRANLYPLHAWYASWMASVEEAMAGFRAAVHPYMAEWDGLDVRLMASRVEGKNVLVLARVREVRNGNVAPPAYIPEVDGLTFRHAVIEPSKLDSMFAGLKEGRLIIEGETFTLDVEGKPPKSATFFVYSRYLGFPAAAAVLEIRMESVSGSRPNNLEQILPAANPPYADPRDLFGSFFGPEHENDDWNPRVVFTLAPGIRIVDLSVGVDTMEAKIEGVNRERAGQIRASLIGRTRDGHEVRWQSDVADGVREEDGVVRWHQRLPEGVTHGRSWFHDRGFLVGETEFSLPDHGRKDGPERVLAVASGDNDFLRNGLDTIGSDSKKLENWVHLLFHCLGWRSLLIGRMGKWETADVIAHPPQGKEVVVVECTTSTPSQSNKLEKLYARSREIARQTSLTVIPVLATVQITTDIPDTAKEEAGKSDIALLTMEDLERLAEMVCEPEGQDASDFIRERIPRQWPESGLLSRFGSRAGFL